MIDLKVGVKNLFLVLTMLVLTSCGAEKEPDDVALGVQSDHVVSGGSSLNPSDNPTHVDITNYPYPQSGEVPQEFDESIFAIPVISEFGGQNSARRPLKGELDVSDSGDPIYTLMIDLPPAIAGFTPELGLKYTGSTEVGDLRNGWAMMGYSEITKCPATKRVDGFVGTVKGLAHDKQRFCLDGEPLILVSGGEYGGAGTEYVTQKKTRVRIKALGTTNGGPEYFEMKAGDGVTKVFGQSRDAKKQGKGIYVWKIDRVIDPSGNEIDYEYSGYRLPVFIYYQGKAEGAKSVRVRFDWTLSESQWVNNDVQPDVLGETQQTLETRYSLGDDLVQADRYRLNKIQVSVGYRNNLVYDEAYFYHFEYDDQGKVNERGLPPKALLKKIFRCEDIPTRAVPEPRCSKPVVFEWGYDYQIENKWDRCDLPTEKMWPGGAQYFSGEYTSSHPLTNNFGWGGGNYYSHVLADFNGDETVDVAVMYTFAEGGNSRMNAWVAYANGDGTYSDSGVQYSEIIGPSGIINNRLAGDFNNDGLADLVAANASGGGWNVYVSLNLGNNTFAKPVHYHLSSENFINDKAYRQVTGDFNGDGNLDLMVFNLGNGVDKTDALYNPVSGLVAYVALGNGDGTFQKGKGRQLVSHRQLAEFWMRNRGLFTADFNGDGITDIGSVFISTENSFFNGPFVAAETVVAFGTPSGEFQDPIIQQRNFIEGFYSNFTGSEDRYFVTDINGDGVMDMLAVRPLGNLNAMSFIGRGDGTFDVRNYWDLGRTRRIGFLEFVLEDAPEDIEQGACSRYGHGVIVADFNRDGYADIAAGSSRFLMGRGDGSFLHQGGVLAKKPDTVQSTGGGISLEGFGIQDTTYGVFALDANQDDSTDILEVVVDSKGLKVGVIPNMIRPQQLKIVGIDESGARKYNIEYDTILNPEVYKRTFEPSWPIRNLRSGKIVVKRVSANNPSGGVHHFDYKYRDWLVDAAQKASYGFREVEMTDSRDGISTLRVLDQNYPKIGLVNEIRQFSKEGTLLSHQAFNWAVDQHTYHSGNQAHTHHVTKLLLNSVRQYNVDGGFISDVTTENRDFDEFGIPWVTDIINSDGNNVRIERQYYSVSSWDDYRAGLLEFESEIRTGSDLNDTVTRETRHDYYPSGLLKQTVIEPNNPDLYLATDYEYYPNGMLKSKTLSGHSSARFSIEPQVETYEYAFTEAALVSSRQYRTDISNGEGHKVSLFRSGLFHQLYRKVDENGLATTFLYDGYGDLYLTTWPDRTKTQTARAVCDDTCPRGAIYRVFTLKDGSPPVVQYYNIDEKEIRTITRGLDGEPVLKETGYDAYGRVVRETEPYSNRENPVRSRMMEYDALGRLTQSISPDEGTTQVRYYATHGKGIRVEKEQVRRSSSGVTPLVTRQEQDMNGRIKQVTDNQNNSATYFYDAFGNLAKIMDAADNETVIEHDERGRKTQITDRDSGTLIFDIDALGRVRRQEDAKKQVITWEYDRLNRATRKITKEGTHYWHYDTAMNGVGKIAQEGSASGYQKTYMYDRYGRQEITNHAWGDYSVDLLTNYDTLGRVRSATVAEDLNIFYSFNDFGHLEKVLNYDPAKPAPSNAMVYWRAGETYPDGRPKRVLLNNESLTQTHEINSYTGRLMRTTTGDRLGGDFTDLGFAFDSLGNLEWRGDYAQGIAERFTYDGLNRLKQAYVNGTLTDSHDYDAIGNITRKSDFGSSYKYGENGAGPRAVSSVTKADGSVIRYGYDSNGNMISGSGRSIEYTSENLPLQVSLAGTAVRFAYDANGKRISRKEDGVTTYYINPAWHTGISFERQTKGTDVVEKLYVAAGGLPIAMSERLNKGAVRHYFFQKDHLGSVVAIFNQSNRVEESTNYKAFGHKRLINQIKQDDSPLISKRTTRGFTGHEHLDRVGLIHMNARLYDKDLGRFISPDTVIPSIANPQSINRYAYVYNNPLSLTDPSGNVPFGAGMFGLVDRMLAHMISQSANAVVGAGTKAGYEGVNHNATVRSAVDQSPAVRSDRIRAATAVRGGYARVENVLGGIAGSSHRPVRNSSNDEISIYFSHAKELSYTENIPFPMPAETRTALKSIMSSPVGVMVRESGKRISLVVSRSMESSFQVVDGEIYYHSNVKAYVADHQKWAIPGDGMDSATLGSLLAHEIGHVIGDGAPVNIRENEIWTVRNFENPYRTHVGLPLRRSYFEEGDVTK
jgi:RHS repeat-associated protein